MEQIDIFELAFSKEGKSEEDESEVEIVESKPEVKVTYEDFDYETLNIYAGIDCIATTEILKKQFPKVIVKEEIIKVGEKENTSSLAPAIIDSFTVLTIPAHEFLIDLEISGMKYSQPRNTFIGNKMIQNIKELDEKIFSVIGKNVDLNSGQKIAEFLYTEKGFKPPNFTKSGEPATDGAAIMTLAGLNPVGGKYVTEDPSMQWLADMAVRRDISSAYNTFIKSYVRDFVKADGRIHPSYNQFGTSSFRITGSNPNLTQLPRNKHGYNIRTCYTVDEGYLFISFDFSSAEVKVLANISEEPAMLKAIEEGLDFHSYSASLMRGIPYEEIIEVLSDNNHPKYVEYKNLRQLVKILLFSLLYGASTAGVAIQMNISKEEAQRIIDLYFSRFPKVRNYIEKYHKFAELNQMTLTPIGQRKRQYGVYSCFKNTAAYTASLRNSQNYGVQGPTSSIGLATFAELNNRIKQFGAFGTCTVNVGGYLQ